MQFFVLGPLRIQRKDESNTVAGIVQRASLGFLLLRPNKVVATTELIQVLWPGKQPVTARKMVQNAISALRGALVVDDGDRFAPALLTHVPGYVLQIDPSTIDLARFLALANQGQVELARGMPEPASGLLREALAMWRGRALADVVDQGIEWPDLQQLETERLRVVEDYVEAELRCGRHASVLNRLTTDVEQAPLRERLHGQLMLALYRSGRQVEALGVYRRLARRLLDEFGVTPGPELQELERSILNQEPSIAPPEARAHAVAVANRPAPAQPDGPEPDSHQVRGPAPTGAEQDALELWPAVERRLLSAVLIDMWPDGTELDLTDPREYFTEAAAVFADEAERNGGYVVGGEGWSILLQLYGVSAVREDDAARAIRAARSVWQRLSARNPRIRVAVATGEALVQLPASPGDRPIVSGAILDRCFALLASGPRRPVSLCALTQELTGGLADGSPRAADPADRLASVPFVGREREVAELVSTLVRTDRQGRPHLVTVLGDSGMGKTRLTTEFAQISNRIRTQARVCTIPLRSVDADDGRTVLEMILWCLQAASAPGAADLTARLAGAIREAVVADQPPGMSTLDYLAESLGGVIEAPRSRAAQLILAACREVVWAAAEQDLIVLVLDDLQHAGDLLLDFLEGLVATSAPARLLVVTTARPNLLDHRPHWSGGLRRATTMTLDALNPLPMTVLSRQLLGREHRDREDAAQRLVALAAGNPYFAVEYAKQSRKRPYRIPAQWSNGASPAWPIPVTIRNLVAARLDVLPTSAKVLLRALALAGDQLSAESVQAQLRWSRTEVEKWLERLDHDQLLRRVSPQGARQPALYAFRTPVVRDVVLWQMPGGTRRVTGTSPQVDEAISDARAEARVTDKRHPADAFDGCPMDG